MSKQYVLVGASAASFGTLHSLIKLDPQAHITVISAETELPYNKCKLADYLAGSIDQKELHLAAFSGKNINFVLGHQVAHIDVIAKKVITEAGQSFAYDTLFLGMGSSPIIPKLLGITAQGVFAFHTNKDANDILEYIKKKSVKKAVVVGAGLSGLEAADALMKYGLSVTIVERNHQVLPSMLSAEAAQFLHSKIIECGGTLVLNASVQEIRVTNQKVSGALVNGTTIDTGIVIIATGLRPNLALCHQAGLESDEHGVVVNEYLQTNIPDIYAGGDLIGAYDQLTNKKVRSCLWPDAMQQGMHAGMAMMGKPKVYGGISMITSTAFFGIKYAQAGLLDEENKLIKNTHDFHHTFAFRDGILKGFQVLGSVHNLGLLRRMLLTQQPISDDLLDF